MQNGDSTAGLGPTTKIPSFLAKENKREHNHPLKFSKLNPINLLLSKVKTRMEGGFTGTLYSAIRKNEAERSLLGYPGSAG